MEKVRPVNWKEECRVRGLHLLQVGGLIVFRSGEGTQISSWRSSVICPMYIYVYGPLGSQIDIQDEIETHATAVFSMHL